MSSISIVISLLIKPHPQSDPSDRGQSLQSTTRHLGGSSPKGGIAMVWSLAAKPMDLLC